MSTSTRPTGRSAGGASHAGSASASTTGAPSPSAPSAGGEAAPPWRCRRRSRRRVRSSKPRRRSRGSRGRRGGCAPSSSRGRSPPRSHSRQSARGGREVAVIVVEAGCVAVLMDEGSLTLPVRGGSGEEACREVLRVHFGSADAQVRVLGTAPGSSTRPVLEVWLARRVAAARDADEGARLHWLPLGELLAGAGAPTLRDPRTLAALGVAARAKALAEWTEIGRAHV